MIKTARVIAFTVTEAGYYLTPQHELDAEQPDIKADLTGKMSTIYGALTQILRARLAAHGETCDLKLIICHNGERFRHGFLSFLIKR